MDQKNEIRNLIRKGRTRQAIQLLLEYAQGNPELSRPVDRMFARFEKNENDRLMGIISYSDYQVQDNRIIDGVLTLLDGSSSNAVDGVTNEVPQKTKRIVWFESNPTSVSTYADEEWRLIKKTYNRSKLKSAFNFEPNPAARVKDLVAELQNQNAYVVQFSGHGNKDGVYVKKLNQGFFHYPPEELLKVLQFMESMPDCLFLNNCFSSEMAEIFVEHVPYVIVNEGEVTGNYSANFSDLFYEYLFDGQTIPDSFERARASMVSETGGKGSARIFHKS